MRLAIAHALLLLAVPAVEELGVVAADAALVLVAGVACTRLPRVATAVTGVVAWAWATGFAEHEYGDLSFSSADLARLAASVLGTVLVAAALRLALVGAAHWSRGRVASPR